MKLLPLTSRYVVALPAARLVVDKATAFNCVVTVERLTCPVGTAPVRLERETNPCFVTLEGSIWKFWTKLEALRTATDEDTTERIDVLFPFPVSAADVTTPVEMPPSPDVTEVQAPPVWTPFTHTALLKKKPDEQEEERPMTLLTLDGSIWKFGTNPPLRTATEDELTPSGLAAVPTPVSAAVVVSVAFDTPKNEFPVIGPFTIRPLGPVRLTVDKNIVWSGTVPPLKTAVIPVRSDPSTAGSLFPGVICTSWEALLKALPCFVTEELSSCAFCTRPDAPRTGTDELLTPSGAPVVPSPTSDPLTWLVPEDAMTPVRPAPPPTNCVAVIVPVMFPAAALIEPELLVARAAAGSMNRATKRSRLIGTRSSCSPSA